MICKRVNTNQKSFTKDTTKLRQKQLWKVNSNNETQVQK